MGSSINDVPKGNLPRGNCSPTPKLTLGQALTLTGVRFSSAAIVWLPPNPKINPDLDPNPNRNRVAIFFGDNCLDTHMMNCRNPPW